MTAAWHDASNLLCVRLDTIGDVLMTTPAIRALKQSSAGRRITLLTSPAGAAVAGLVPEIDNVLVYEAPWMKASQPRFDSCSDHAMISRLRDGRFDGAVIFTVYTQNPLPAALLCHLAGIPLRLAYCRENPYQLLTHWQVEEEPERLVRHEVQRQLDLVAAVDAFTDDVRLSLRVPETARSSVVTLLELRGIDQTRPWAVIHPGASAASRRYPVEAFAEVARLLVQEAGWQIVLTGSEDEQALVADLAQRAGIACASFAGDLDLGELAALIAEAPLLITNNTGPAHIAAAVGTPIVDIYALTNPQHTPWAVPNRLLQHDVPCRHCYKSICPEGHHACLRSITPREVVAAARELLLATSTKEGQRLAVR